MLIFILHGGAVSTPSDPPDESVWRPTHGGECGGVELHGKCNYQTMKYATYEKAIRTCWLLQWRFVMEMPCQGHSHAMALPHGIAMAKSWHIHRTLPQR